MANKVGGAFATGASISSGKEVTILTIVGAMLLNQMIVVSGGGGFSASATTGPTSPGIDDKELADARDLGKRVAEVARYTASLKCANECESCKAAMIQWADVLDPPEPVAEADRKPDHSG